MKNFISRLAGSAFGGKKIIIMSVAAAFMPLLAGAATLNNTFNIGTLFTVAGSTTNVASSCGTAGANNTVSFALLQNGNYTQLPLSLSTDLNGAFSGNVSFPASYNSGTAILVATCNRSGDTINSPVLTFAAQTSASFGLSGVLPSIGGLYALSGACGNSNGVGSVQLTLVKNSQVYPLGTVNLTPIGTFTSNAVIPSNISSGAATLRAVCSNGTNFSSDITIDEAAVNSFAFNPSPLQGAVSTVSGNCSNVSGNANGSVAFSVIRNGIISSLSVSNNQTNSNGSFSSQVFFPSSFGSEPATFVVICPNSSSYSNVIMLRSSTPEVLAASTTPIGGVDAGYGFQGRSGNLGIYGALFVLGFIGLFAVMGKRFYA